MSLTAKPTYKSTARTETQTKPRRERVKERKATTRAAAHRDLGAIVSSLAASASVWLAVNDNPSSEASRKSAADVLRLCAARAAVELGAKEPGLRDHLKAIIEAWDAWDPDNTKDIVGWVRGCNALEFAIDAARPGDALRAEVARLEPRSRWQSHAFALPKKT